MISNEEHTAINEGLAFANLSRTLLQVSGGDRQKFLHNLCTNDVLGLQNGQSCEAFFTNVQGKTLCHALFICEEDSVLISTDTDFADTLLAHLDKYLIREDVQLVDLSEEMPTILLSGKATATWLDENLGAVPVCMLDHLLSTVDGIRIVRVPFAKEAFYLLVPKQHMEKTVTSLTSNGTSVGCEAIEWQRISARFPSSGRDLTLKNLPQEIDRDDLAISFVKGCYLGQETVARLDALGHVNKKLVQLEFAAEIPAQDGTELSLDGKVVGVVTSAVVSPDGQPPIGLGMVQVAAIDAKQDLQSANGLVKVIA